MKIHAYQEIFIDNAQALLGDAFDYAINIYKISGEDFIKMFVVSDVSKKIENGDPVIILGKSGIELLQEIVFETTGNKIPIKESNQLSRSKQYWIGFSIAYYQWYSNHKFSEIFEVLSYNELERMYSTLHEADISKFVDIVDARVQEFYPNTNLKRIRTNYGISQSELAKRSHVGLRSIQMYEQRKKDINKASAETLYKISKILGCKIEDLLEK